MTEQSPASEQLAHLREQVARLNGEINEHREEFAELLDDSEPGTEPAPAHGKLWSLLDWSFWGAGMGDTFREPLADTMLAAVPTETVEQAEAVMTDFLERRKIEKTGVTIYQEQRDEVEQLRAELAEMTRLRDNALRALHHGDVEIDVHLDELLADGLHGLAEWDTEPSDQAPDWLINAVVALVRPVLAKATEQRDQARRIAVALEQENAQLTAAVGGYIDCPTCRAARPVGEDCGNCAFKARMDAELKARELR